MVTARPADDGSRLRAEEALGQSEERFRLLVEGVKDYATFMIDPDGHIASWNIGAQRIMGFAASEIVGRHVSVLFEDQDAGSAERELEIARSEGRFEEEGWRVRRDGSSFLAIVLLTAVHDADGVLRGFVKVIRDITERRRAEDENRLLEARLQQAQRLESLGQLAGGVAHDFNNLLAAILNYADLITGELEDPESVKKDIAEIKRAAERAAALTHQLLIFGRLEVVKPEIINMNEIIADVENLLRSTIGEHVDLRMDLADHLWPIKVDPSGIEQVLMNLVVNARDAMPTGGILSIKTKHAEIADEPAHATSQLAQGSYVQLSVSDTGTGMTPEVAAHVFEPFFTTKPKGSGSGLGLATVYGIVTQAGGEVTVRTEPGEGTTVRVYLPATAEVAVRVPVPPALSTLESLGETILLVEDEEQVREPTCRTLAHRGYVVLEASNGDEALAIASKHDGVIDLLLTDVVMPGMSGKELAEQLGRARGDMRVLFMSGYLADLLERGAIAAGIPFLEKPFTAVQLLKEVRRALEIARPALGGSVALS
jgi:two-component system cell cycle sensor histidine kinase/response regulator CckA